MTRHILAYTIENQSIADEYVQYLGQADYEFDRLVVAPEDTITLSQQLLETNTPTTLLISDNFLKSTRCMDGALPLIEHIAGADHILPVIIDGTTIVDDVITNVPTLFERVSQVINYMNYWQDEYLQLRKESRNIPYSEEEVFSKKLKVVRAISSEMGEFLRILKGVRHFRYEELKALNFDPFFKFYNDMDAVLSIHDTSGEDVVSETSQGLSLENISTSTTNTPEPSNDLIHLIESSSDQILEENIDPEDATPKEGNTRIADADDFDIDILSEIPGMSLLADHQVVSGIVDETSMSRKPEIVANHDESEKILSEVFEEEDDEDISYDGLSIPSAEKAPDFLMDNVREKFSQGAISEATNLLRAAVLDYPNDPAINYNYGLILMNNPTDAAIAKPFLDKAIVLDTNFKEALFLRGEIAEHENILPSAIQYYQRVYELDTEFQDVGERLERLVMQNLDLYPKAASRFIKKSLQKSPKDEGLNYQYAVLLNEGLGKTKKAIKYFNATLALNPEHEFANYDLATIYFGLKAFDMANAYYRQAIALNPELQTEANDKAFSLRSSPTDVGGLFDESENDLTTEHLGFVSDVEELENEDTLIETVHVPIQTEDIVMITGATSGIGLATAKLFASAGYNLILTGRREERLSTLAESLKKEHEIDVLTLSFDVRDLESVQEAVEGLDKQWQNVDILINNAGLAKGFSSIHNGEIEHWETMIDTNIKGLLYMTRAIAPSMVKRESGQIINICSVAGHEVYPNGNVYCATKHAVDALTKAMRIDLVKYGIRVGQVSPGHVEQTEFARVRFDDIEKAKIYEDFVPLNSNDVAEAIYFMVTRPKHVSIQDIQIFGTQQASATIVDRSGR